MKRLLTLLVLLILPGGLAACGEKNEPITPSSSAKQHLNLLLDWFPNADHVGIYQALAKGYFSQAGLDVHIQVPANVANPLQLVAAGKADVAVSYEPEVLLARDQNLPLVSIAAIVQEPLTSIISIGKHPIRRAAELRGKTVGDAGISYQHAYLRTIERYAHLSPSSVKEVNVGSNLVSTLVAGRVNAILGGYWNYEAVQLAQLGRRPQVIRMNQVGVPTYDELVLVTRTGLLEQHPDVMRRFVQAVARGYESVRADPAGAVANLVRMNPGLNEKLQLASVRATLPAFFPRQAGRPWGWQDPGQWNAYGQWMLSHHLISNPNAVAAASTNELLAGQGI
jgi:putative hydroxymethylpyrimidine transport system substrate-binding protein